MTETAPAELERTFRPADLQAEFYAAWEAAHAFACDPASARPPYCIMMPPPNVTGSLHMGHALTFTLQDILIRFARMRGRDALWQPGTDHAGIATQMVVERQIASQGLTRQALGREAFLAHVWDWKAQSGGAITRQLRSLGASPDWSRERFTMDEGLSRAVRKVFVALHKEGLIYRDKRLVNWDPTLHTAVSDLEVENRETKGSLWYVKYPIAERPGAFITVATTRPETMLGDTGIAVHPDDDRHRDLVGCHAVLPLAGRAIPIVADPYADPTTGSGAVKITPAHDFNDFEVGRRHGLALITVMDRDAKIIDPAPEPYRGLDRFEARKRVVSDLEAQGLIAKVEDQIHTVPHGDRSGVVLEPYLTDQWFCDAKTLARAAIDAVETGRTRFVPRQWENTFFEWMRNIQPWCISRQIWWGHQIPAWYAPDGRIFVAEDEAAAHAQAKAQYGHDVTLERDGDVLDTWFSSALWPFSTLGWPDETRELARYYPTDVLVTGFDIIFFWVARMMMMGCKFMEDVPFRTVYIHALVRDERGQKMSKSKGNIVDPLEVIDTYGCDALRFTLAALAAQGRDIKLAESRIEGYRNFATKLWNAARFAEMNRCEYRADFDPAAATLTVNRWIATSLDTCARRVTTALEDYRFNEAADAIYHFTWHSFCDWYIEFIKPILSDSGREAQAETRAMTAWVIGEICHLLHPMMPFITEALWRHLAGPGAGLLIGSRWPHQGSGGDADAAAEMEWIVALVSSIRTARAEMNVPGGAEIPARLVTSDPDRARIGRDHGALIRRLARLAAIEVEAEAPRDKAAGALQVVVEGATVWLDLAGVIDVEAERKRLAREAAVLKGELDKIAQKLANPQFVAKAKPDVIEEQREREADAQAKLARIDAAIARIGG